VEKVWIGSGLRSGLLVLAMALLAACTPQTALLLQALPEGSISTLLGNLQKVDDTNRVRLEELERRGDWDGIARFAEENLVKDRGNSDWWLVAGYAYSQLARHADATRCYAEMVQLAPDDLLGWNLLAQAYRAAGSRSARSRRSTTLFGYALTPRPRGSCWARVTAISAVSSRRSARTARPCGWTTNWRRRGSGWERYSRGSGGSRSSKKWWVPRWLDPARQRAGAGCAASPTMASPWKRGGNTFVCRRS
jgi:hypothetical protein